MSNVNDLGDVATLRVYALTAVLEVYSNPEIGPDLAHAFAQGVEDNLGVDMSSFLELHYIGCDCEDDEDDDEEGDPHLTPFAEVNLSGCMSQDLAEALSKERARAVVGGLVDRLNELAAKDVANSAIRKAMGGN